MGWVADLMGLQASNESGEGSYRGCLRVPFRKHKLMALTVAGATGVQDLSWDLVAKHLGRGKRSVMRKYDNLRTGMMAAGESAGFLPALCQSVVAKQL